MIEFNYNVETPEFDEERVKNWIGDELELRGFTEGDLMYTFVSDEELLKINKEFLNHDTYTDIISFDYTMGKLVSGEIFISVERVKENSVEYKVTFLSELYRVIIHGILHFCGLRDETEQECETMRSSEDAALKRLV